MQLHPSPLQKENRVDSMIFYQLKLQMPSQGLQTKIGIHYKHQMKYPNNWNFPKIRNIEWKVK